MRGKFYQNGRGGHKRTRVITCALRKSYGNLHHHGANRKKLPNSEIELGGEVKASQNQSDYVSGGCACAVVGAIAIEIFK